MGGREREEGEGRMKPVTEELFYNLYPRFTSTMCKYNVCCNWPLKHYPGSFGILTRPVAKQSWSWAEKCEVVQLRPHYRLHCTRS